MFSAARRRLRLAVKRFLENTEIKYACGSGLAARKRYRSFGRFIKAFRNSATAETDYPLRLPHDYQYSDADPKSVVQPATPFGDSVDLTVGPSRSAAYAAWMTSDSNPRFAKVIANRLWKRAMGIGLIEPVDDLDSGDAVGDKRLLQYLTQLMRDVNYDLIKFQKILYRTELFQRRAVNFEIGDGQRFLYPGPRHRRMSAEQIWDSMGILIRADFDGTIAKKRETLGSRYKKNTYNTLRQLNDGEAILQRTEAVAELVASATEKTYEYRREFDKLAASKDDAAASRWLDKLLAENDRDLSKFSELTGNGDDPGPAKMAQTGFHNQRQALVRIATTKFPKLKDRYIKHFFHDTPGKIAAQARNDKKNAAIQNELKRLKATGDAAAVKRFQRALAHQEKTAGIKRASELGNPSPETHLLREMGQSDRELINNSRRESSIPLHLEFRNGSIVSQLNDPETQLWSHLRELDSNTAIIRSLYQQMLTRPPRPEELELLRPEFQSTTNDGIETTVWILLNTAEFVFLP
ncbi:DUF1553 domain-containing protein [Neorhodopirellula pilleata]|uniref:DUF1553 domain-containing protein n=1 Tax=Neorhodopirellula pilleata TaxID=2714738 RepID=A0A5C6AAR4_9BACT|nr:DUF1553 domain-containing protein [Neorhodopirellula pilleata]TWT96526.1 hypothetical protein Pla100_30090 [Neorhodopirellula pilleata]